MKKGLRVDFAYPYSTNAKYYHMEKTGCFYISNPNPGNKDKPRVRFSRMGFVNEQDAVAALKEWEES